jgi:hypothetical protein
MCKAFIILLFSQLLFHANVNAQTNDGLLNASDHFNKGRFNTVIISEAAVGTVITIGLQYLWYKKFPKSHFHFFNDNDEWLNMDKVGHATTAYNISAIQYNAMRWCGVNRHSATLIGGLTGLGYMLMIEISDGFSAEWGFSKGDMAANIFGSALFMSQQYAWGQQKMQLRFSYHNTIFAKYNPGELGRNLPQRLLKDYNGQTYWLSLNIPSIIRTGNNFPHWLNADIGYGAEGMISAVTNPKTIKDLAIPDFTRSRKLFFSIDGAFAKKGSMPFPSWINIIHLPVPALEVKLKSQFPVRFLPVYF